MSATPVRVTIAIPIHNEEEVIPQLLERVLAVLDDTPGGPHEMLLIDDGSRDRSLELLEEAARKDDRIVVVVLSRNFGHQAALTTAFDHARGDVMLLMDGDLQDPPEALPQLLARMADGYDVVYVRRTRRKEAWWLRVSYHVAYRIIARLSKLALPVDAGDFALLSRRAIEAMRALPERQRYLRGLRSWIGFRQTGVDVERAARAGGASKYSLRRLIGLALDGAFAFSTTPLRFIGVFGGVVLAGSVLFSLFAIYAKLALGRSPQGFTALTVLGTMIGGMVLLSLWIIGEYVGRIYAEVKHRPVYLVDRVIRSARSAAGTSDATTDHTEGRSATHVAS
ncbi:MAG TPA: glycosyltransferase family 2 protein [Gemmatimonadaceae bacterium]|nr:glycosyltransferase family 2 protein [Gemmatimonadaceae bacterium]